MPGKGPSIGRTSIKTGPSLTTGELKLFKNLVRVRKARSRRDF